MKTIITVNDMYGMADAAYGVGDLLAGDSYTKSAEIRSSKFDALISVVSSLSNYQATVPSCAGFAIKILNDYGDELTSFQLAKLEDILDETKRMWRRK